MSKELNKKIANLSKEVESLYEANTYLHSIREIWVFEELYKMARDRKYARLQVSQNYIKNEKTKKYETSYNVYIIFNNKEDSKNLSLKFKSFDEIESYFFGNTIENDEDLL